MKAMFLSLFHQVMGVKDLLALLNDLLALVSIPFSSGHGGKEFKKQAEDLQKIKFLSLFHQVMGVKTSSIRRGARLSLFLSLFHQVMGVKGAKKIPIFFGCVVSIPFSSGHGGKGCRNNRTAEPDNFVSIPFSSGHGGKVANAGSSRGGQMGFYPFFIRSWG